MIKKPATATAATATPAATAVVGATGMDSDEKLKWNTGKVESEDRTKWSAAEVRVYVRVQCV